MKRDRNLYLTYAEAKEVVNKLNIKSFKQFHELKRKESKDLEKIPLHPQNFYSEWTKANDFFIKKDFFTLDEAKEEVRKFGVNSYNSFLRLRSKMSDKMPSYPRLTYSKKGWKGWADFFGNDYTVITENDVLSFEEAKLLIRGFKFPSRVDYTEFYKNNEELLYNILPLRPEKVYKDWISWIDFLGHEYYKIFTYTEYMSFDESKEYMKKYNLSSQSEWQSFRKTLDRPSTIPVHPDIVYKNKGWLGFADWLGYNDPKLYPSYKEVVNYLRDKGLRTKHDYIKFIRNNKDNINLPINPSEVYKKFDSWIKFLSYKKKEKVKSEYSSKKLKLEDAIILLAGYNVTPENYRNFLESKIDSGRLEFKKLSRNPHLYYKNWTSWEKYLSLGKVYLTYNEVKKIIKTFRIDSDIKYQSIRDIKNLHGMLPQNPKDYYTKNGTWISEDDFYNQIKSERKMNKKATFRQARQFARNLKLNTRKEWREYVNNNQVPQRIPTNPEYHYAKSEEWVSWADFLGTELPSRNKVELISYNELKKTLKAKKINTHSKWLEFSRNGNRPTNIPYHPERVYSNRNEWVSWDDLLSK